MPLGNMASLCNIMLLTCVQHVYTCVQQLYQLKLSLASFFYLSRADIVRLRIHADLQRRVPARHGVDV